MNIVVCIKQDLEKFQSIGNDRVGKKPRILVLTVAKGCVYRKDGVKKSKISHHFLIS